VALKTMDVIRSFLFAPANQPDRLKKFPRFVADVYVIDLEDGTPESDKAQARAQLPAVVAYLREQPLRGRLFVRVNEPGNAHTEADLKAALATDIDGIVVPKFETAGQVREFGAALALKEALGGRELSIIGGIESMRGVIEVFSLASADPHLGALYFGAEDYITDIGGRRTAQGLEALYARSQTVLAAKAAGIAAIDQAVIEIRDEPRFCEDAEFGCNLGYGGKICLLPRQVELANAIFSPAPAAIERCRRLLQAAERADAKGFGAFDFEGRMIDGPLLKRARAIVALADRIAAGERLDA